MFSLTPTLSRWERGLFAPRPAIKSVRDCNVVHHYFASQCGNNSLSQRERARVRESAVHTPVLRHWLKALSHPQQKQAGNEVISNWH